MITLLCTLSKEVDNIGGDDFGVINTYAKQEAERYINENELRDGNGHLLTVPTVTLFGGEY